MSYDKSDKIGKPSAEKIGKYQNSSYLVNVILAAEYILWAFW